jgi:DNA phosphorothioation-associated putative methyltransferase
MQAFFGTYAKASHLADELLFRAGDATACKRSPIGKLIPDDLYVHRSALDHLEPLLRIYEGCGRAYLGEVEGANIIEIHRRSGKLSYLIYPDFETDPHPVLQRCVRLSLRTRALDCYDYGVTKKGTVPEGQRDSPLFHNPPILHRKETFLHPSQPLHAKFARLTQQEEKAGLLDAPSRIGTRTAWLARLQAHGLTLRGHRLIKLSPAKAEMP